MKRLRNILPVALLCMLALSCRNTASDTDRRIERLLAGMTLQEKVGQMAQLTIEPFVIADGAGGFTLDTALLREAVVEYGVGSLLNVPLSESQPAEVWGPFIGELQRIATDETRLGIPLIYGVDQVHGGTYSLGSTLFPQQIALAATWNPAHARRMGEITAYEISKALNYKPCVVETPLGEATVEMIDDQLVVATILRAGLPYHQGFLNYFDDAQNAFVSAYRKSTKDGKFTVKVEYISCGSLEGKTLLLVDPMLATGSSLVLTYNALCEKGGTPAYTHVAAVVASEQGLDYAMKNMPRKTTTIWTAVVDEELTSRSYIVPGIGDAGDLAYGEKI